MANYKTPITQWRPEILETIRKNAVTIITADTGAGKSTQVPQYLLDDGYSVLVTQPRRLAARTIAARVAEEYGCQLGETVGYQVSGDRRTSFQTACLFVTDGLASIKALIGRMQHAVIVIDEAHEFNLNVEVLIAWCRRELKKGADFKLVLMSATIETQSLSRFFDGCPVIDVPGRLFPITDRPVSINLNLDIIDLLRLRRNILVFETGKEEITKRIDAIKELIELTPGISTHQVVLLPLHGDLSPEEQQRCFKHYSVPKVIVSTNVAQTSVTIDDVDAVVDVGMEKRTEVHNGVEGLFIQPISRQAAKQRRGRAGRTRPGIYIDGCEIPMTERDEYDKPEIFRTRLDQTVLRLLEYGIDMEEMEFFHQPLQSDIHKAKESLKLLGCITNEGKVTAIGREVAKLPISAQFARMVVEGKRYGVVDDVITVASILEHGEFTHRRSTEWITLVPDEVREGTSDVLTYLALYKACDRLSKQQLRDHGIMIKGYFQVRETRQQIHNALRGEYRDVPHTGTEDDVIVAVISGMMDNLWQYNFSGLTRTSDWLSRQPAKTSVVRMTAETRLIIGLPFDLQVPDQRYGGTKTVHMVRMMTRVTTQQLIKAAPHLCEEMTAQNFSYVPYRDRIIKMVQLRVNGEALGFQAEEDTTSEQGIVVFTEWLANAMLTGVMDGVEFHLIRMVSTNHGVLENRKRWNGIAEREVFPIPTYSVLAGMIRRVLGDVRCQRDIHHPDRLALPDVDPRETAKITRGHAASKESLQLLKKKFG